MGIQEESSPAAAAWSRRAILVLWVTIAVILTYIHLMAIDHPNYDRQLTMHQRIVAHTAPSPFQYRLLQSMLVDAVLHVPGVPGFVLFHTGYLGIRFACIMVTLAAVWVLGKHFVSPQAALAGPLLVAVVIPFTYFRYYFQPSSVMEWAVFALGFVFIVRGQAGALALLTLLGTLNRETTVFLAAFYVLYHWGQRPLRRLTAETALIVVCWAIPFITVRSLWPAASSIGDAAGYIRYNLTMLSVWVEAGIIVVPFLAVALFNMRAKPPALLRCLLVIPAWLALHFVFSQMNEVRYYVPLLIPEIPLILLTVFPEAARWRQEAAALRAV